MKYQVMWPGVIHKIKQIAQPNPDTQFDQLPLCLITEKLHAYYDGVRYVHIS